MTIHWASVLLGFVPGLLIGAMAMLYLIDLQLRFIWRSEG